MIILFFQDVLLLYVFEQSSKQKLFLIFSKSSLFPNNKIKGCNLCKMRKSGRYFCLSDFFFLPLQR